MASDTIMIPANTLPLRKGTIYKNHPLYGGTFTFENNVLTVMIKVEAQTDRNREQACPLKITYAIRVNDGFLANPELIYIHRKTLADHENRSSNSIYGNIDLNIASFSSSGESRSQSARLIRIALPELSGLPSQLFSEALQMAYLPYSGGQVLYPKEFSLSGDRLPLTNGRVQIDPSSSPLFNAHAEYDLKNQLLVVEAYPPEGPGPTTQRAEGKVIKMYIRADPELRSATLTHIEASYRPTTAIEKPSLRSRRSPLRPGALCEIPLVQLVLKR